MGPFYLKTLVIQNLATFKNQKINFTPGLNAIIGETGSGKSLVLDALQFILGGRADKRIVRRESEYSLIEATFFCDDEQVKFFMESEGFPTEGHEIFIKRMIYKNGTTKNYVNHLSCTVGFLSLFSRKFIDLVGQFENQKLLSESYQLQLLDQYCKHLGDVESFKTILDEFRNLKKEKEKLQNSRTEREQKLDYINFQLQEIQKLNPSSQDEEELLKKKNLLLNFERTQKICHQINEFFEGGEGHSGILGSLKMLRHLLSKNTDVFPHQIELLSEAEDQLLSIKVNVEKKLGQDVDPQEINFILERLDLYQRLKKKFGGSIQFINTAQEDFLKEKSRLEELDLNLDSFEKRLFELEKELQTRALNLHLARLKHSVVLSEDLTRRVRSLKMNGATVKLEIEQIDEFNDFGRSKINFIAETNPGEGFFKIKDIASGGELSRVLLSLRQVLSSVDSISIFLFDEIDTGIGGETGSSIGKALVEVATHGQVVAITHLPQIAKFADNLIVVNKDIFEKGNEARTESTVREIKGKEVLRQVRAMADLG